MPFWKKVVRIPNYIAIGLIQVYRLIFSPTVGILRFLPGYSRPTCIFYPTCSAYAIETFEKYGFFKAFHKTLDRIGRCHPGNDPQVDLP